jgi:hypothetical protein
MLIPLEKCEVRSFMPTDASSIARHANNRKIWINLRDSADVLSAMTPWAIQAYGLSRVFAVPFEWNTASMRVLEKVGYAFEGRMRRSAIKDGKIVDQLLYAHVVPA